MKKLLIPAIFIVFGLMNSSYLLTESPTEIAKQLIFPVAGDQATVGSVWGDERDGGRRKHEGIDIFAARGTYVLAISDGYIESIRYDDLGGNNITLQPDDYTWNAYYAHLDKIYVKAGQQVRKGQLIGSVGNTGNAKTTPPHLHFGTYSQSNVAFDPLPYVRSSPRLSSPVAPDDSQGNKTAGTKKQRTSAPKTSTGRQVENAVKQTAVQVLTEAVLKKIRIRL